MKHKQNFTKNLSSFCEITQQLEITQELSIPQKRPPESAYIMGE